MGVEPTNGIGGKLEALSNLFPVLVLVLFSFLQQIPTRIPEFSYITPSLVTIGIFYWCIYRPDLIPMIAVFGIGIFEDIMTNTLIGFNALIFLTIYGLCRWRRRFFYKQTFVVMWVGLMIVVASISMMQWILFMIIHGQVLSFTPLLFGALATILIYPLVAIVLSKIHNKLPSEV